MGNIKALYEKNIKKYEDEIRVLKKQYNRISWARGIVFLGGIWAVYALMQINPGLGLVVGIGFFLLFFYLMSIHSKLADAKEFMENLLSVNIDEIRALNGDVKHFLDGEEFLFAKHAFAHDLDILGKASIFQYINRTATALGKKDLAYSLLFPLQHIEEISAHQRAVEELKEKQDWGHAFQAEGMGKLESMQEVEKIVKWAKSPRYLSPQGGIHVIMNVLTGLFILSFILWMFQGVMFQMHLFSWHVPTLFFFINLGVVGKFLKTTQTAQAQLGETSRLLSKYARILKKIETESWKSPFLADLQSKLLDEEESNAGEAIYSLSQLGYYFDQRLNLIMGFIINGALLWDLQCLMRLDRWKLKYQERIPQWWEVMGKMDALVSLGRYAFNHPMHTMPELQSEEFHLKAKNLGHPLIDPETRIDNDVDIQPGQFLLITGANMAGKSTFLRTVGVNLVLAMAGAPVCATSFSFAPIFLISSIRTEDSLEENASYFYAELQRLKQIIDTLKSKGSAFIILDEMLRGTNSLDKQTGSKRYIEHLLALKGCGLIATHDLQLASLEEMYSRKVKNMRFEVEIEGDALHFNYLLEEGISQNLNATFLMEQMGIMLDKTLNTQ